MMVISLQHLPKFEVVLRGTDDANRKENGRATEDKLSLVRLHDSERIIDDHDRSPPITCRSRAWIIFRRNLLMVILLSSVFIGFILGSCLRYIPMSPIQKHYLGFPGDLLMNMLKMIILPLVISSLVSSMASLNSNFVGRIGLHTLIYYICTSIIATIIGIVLVLTIKPGSGDREMTSSAGADSINPLDAFLDMIR